MKNLLLIICSLFGHRVGTFKQFDPINLSLNTHCLRCKRKLISFPGSDRWIGHED